MADQRMIGVTSVSQEVSCLGRSWASDQEESSLNPDSISLAKWVNNPYLTSFLVLLTRENKAVARLLAWSSGLWAFRESGPQVQGLGPVGGGPAQHCFLWESLGLRAHGLG